MEGRPSESERKARIGAERRAIGSGKGCYGRGGGGNVECVGICVLHGWRGIVGSQLEVGLMPDLGDGSWRERGL